MQQPAEAAKVSWGIVVVAGDTIRGGYRASVRAGTSNSAKRTQELEAMGGSAADQFTVRSGVCRAALVDASGNLLEGVPAGLIRGRWLGLGRR
jgi:hypothetical protein